LISALRAAAVRRERTASTAETVAGFAIASDDITANAQHVKTTIFLIRYSSLQALLCRLLPETEFAAAVKLGR